MDPLVADLVAAFVKVLAAHEPVALTKMLNNAMITMVEQAWAVVPWLFGKMLCSHHSHTLPSNSTGAPDVRGHQNLRAHTNRHSRRNSTMMSVGKLKSVLSGSHAPFCAKAKVAQPTKGVRN